MTTKNMSAVARTAGAIALGIPLSCLAAGAAVAGVAPTADADTQAPVSSFHRGTTPPSGWNRAAVPVRLTADDDGGSGVASIEYRLGDGPVVSTGTDDVSLTLTEDGETTITIWAIDEAGNAEAPHSLTVRIDRTAPGIRIGTPARVAQGSTVLFAVTCDDAHSGVASCESNVADGSPLPTAELGAHTVAVSAVDVAGNLTSIEFVYEVVADAEGPTVTASTAPEPTSGWYRSRIGVGLEASDPSGVASIHWATLGPVAANGDIVGESSALVSIDAEGVTELRYWAIDAFGNRSVEQSRVVRIDTVAPQIAVGLPDLAATLPRFEQGAVEELVFGCFDATSGTASCGIDGQTDDLLDTSRVGTHRVTVVGTDVAGNTATRDYEYRVVARDGGAGGGSGSGGGSGAGAGSGSGASDRPGTEVPTLAHTGADPAGLLLVGGLLAGAGAGVAGAHRLLTRRFG